MTLERKLRDEFGYFAFQIPAQNHQRNVESFILATLVGGQTSFKTSIMSVYLRFCHVFAWFGLKKTPKKDMDVPNTQDLEFGYSKFLKVAKTKKKL